MQTARWFDFPRNAGIICMLLALAACGNGIAPGDREVSGRGDAAVPQQPVAAPEPTTPAEVAPATDDGMHQASFEARQARRLAQAQVYLDRATDDAQSRHRLASGRCEQAATADFEACIATADDSLQAELRAARVEFDRQMAQTED